MTVEEDQIRDLPKGDAVGRDRPDEPVLKVYRVPVRLWLGYQRGNCEDQQNRQKVSRYTSVSEAVNEARDMINEPGSVATPEYLAEAADFAGLTRDGEPADSGADLGTTAKARVAQRRDDIREIRAVIALVRDAVGLAANQR